jgi:hypothetical protein
MFRYKLRTLLIALALGPPVLWGAWWAIQDRGILLGLVGSLLAVAGIVVPAGLVCVCGIGVRKIMRHRRRTT